MVAFLMIISFLLHLAALAAIYKLFMQLQTMKNEEPAEILELMELHLQEIREENERLSKLLGQSEERSHGKGPYGNKDMEKVSEHGDILASQEDSKEDLLVASLEAQVLQLHKGGVPMEEISKRLNCGVGEVEIIIKLYEK